MKKVAPLLVHLYAQENSLLLLSKQHSKMFSDLGYRKQACNRIYINAKFIQDL